MEVSPPPFCAGTIYLKHRHDWNYPFTPKMYEPYTANVMLHYDEVMVMQFRFAHPQKTESTFWKIPFVMNEDGKTPYFDTFEIFKIETKKFIIQGNIIDFNKELNCQEIWQFIAEIRSFRMPDFIQYWDVTN